MNQKRVAVIGSGVSGLVAAYALRETHHVTLFEAASRLGGHAHTHQIPKSLADPAITCAVDSGFIVHNRLTYPTLIKIFAELEVATQPAEMSMSISCAECGLSYAGGRGLGGVFAQPKQILNPKFLSLLRHVQKFHREAKQVLADPGDQRTWGEFLQNYPPYFVAHFAIPLVACVWSSTAETAEKYPARYLFEFLANHHMLQIKGSPQWRTVTDGSAAYVAKIAALIPEIHLATPVNKVRREANQILVQTADKSRYFDQVVLAIPADYAAGILAEPSPAESQTLAAFSYSENPTVLHRDESYLPTQTGARASWNYQLNRCTDQQARLTYWMTKLQSLPTSEPALVTLHGKTEISAELRHAEMQYRHPIFTAQTVAAAKELANLGGPNLAFAGAHLGWGFHEDGARSGMLAAQKLGAKWSV